MKLLLRAKNISTVFGVMADYMTSGMMNNHKKPFLGHMNKMLSVRMIWGQKLD